jgi:SAM-dependent methyltransferase
LIIGSQGMTVTTATIVVVGGKDLDHAYDRLQLRRQERVSEVERPLPGVHPSPNIQKHPKIYEWENLAADPEGKLEAAMWRLNPWSGKTFMDIGCGTGFHLPRFATKAARVIGIEPHRASLLRAQARVRSLANVEILRGAAEALPIDDASIDVAHARFAYFFGSRAEAGIIELQRVMRSGGSAFVIDNDTSWGDFAGWLGRSSWFSPPAPTDAAFWLELGFETQAIHSEWRFATRKRLEQVLGIEFPPDLLSQILVEHSGLAITYGYLLRHRAY